MNHSLFPWTLTSFATLIDTQTSGVINTTQKPMSSADSHPFHFLSIQWATLFLTFVGGFIDAVGYIEFFQLFTSSITGNVIVACTALFKDTGGVFARVFVTLSFAVGSFVTSALYIRLRYVLTVDVWTTAMIQFSGEIVVLLMTLAIGVYIQSTPQQYPTLESWQTILVGSLMALSMGAQNSATLSTMQNAPATTVVTTTIVKTSTFGAYLLEYYLMYCGWLNPQPVLSHDVVAERFSENFKKFAVYVSVILSFVAGAVVGAVLVLQIHLWCLWVPIAILLLIVADVYCAKQAAQLQPRTVVGNIDDQGFELPAVVSSTSGCDRSAAPATDECKS